MSENSRSLISISHAIRGQKQAVMRTYIAKAAVWGMEVLMTQRLSKNKNGKRRWVAMNKIVRRTKERIKKKQN